jgi:hypothetical protein
VHVIVTIPVKPLPVVAVTVYFAELPASTVWLPGLTANLKLDDTFPVLSKTVNVLLEFRPPFATKSPECFAQLRRLLEARLGKPGKREYVQVLRLLETFRREEVRQAIQDALHLGTVSCDAVKHLLLCRIERRPPRLDLLQYPYLPLPQVHTTQAVDYMTLLNEVGS